MQNNTGKQVEALKRKQINSLKKYRKTQTDVGIEQSGPRPKTRSRNNKENRNGGKPENGKPKKEVMSYRCKHQQQNTRNRRENLRCRRYCRRD